MPGAALKPPGEGRDDPRTQAVKAGKMTGMTDQARAHWAFQPLKPLDTVLRKAIAVRVPLWPSIRTHWPL